MNEGHYKSHIAITTSTPDQIERFLKDYEILPNGCWRWTRLLNAGGYGSGYINGTIVLVCRVVLFRKQGYLNEEMCSRHSCNNPCCINPNHLCEGTWKDNNDDKMKAGRNRFVTGRNHWTNIRPADVPRGDTHYKTKIPDCEIGVILKMKRDGARRVDIARKYGVTPGMIGHIIKGRIRQHDVIL